MSRQHIITACLESDRIYARKSQVIASQHRGHTHVELGAANDRTGNEGDGIEALLNHFTVAQRQPRKRKPAKVTRISLAKASFRKATRKVNRFVKDVL